MSEATTGTPGADPETGRRHARHGAGAGPGDGVEPVGRGAGAGPGDGVEPVGRGVNAGSGNGVGSGAPGGLGATAGSGGAAEPGTSTGDPVVPPAAGGSAPASAPAVTDDAATPLSDRPLLPPGEAGRLGEGLRQAVAGFVDAPRASVEEADRVLEELGARLTEALAHRRRSLLGSWQEAGTDTEQLRLALRDYRELADRLMRL
ncbi:hypothetical protein ABZZ92_02575 [Streptomyces ardesiacus]|uniref:hypothetical protein n=1 Tax=Streptomyces ardesiacus TaxID=285564 RepID=UPI0033AA4F85